ncbi:MAG TPA: MFS transporter [Planctomycetaceae bacterium]|nr:MFS transporter [Planctomycetaceae bacterium]
MDASKLRRSMRLSITEGALATAMGTLLSGVFLTGFALSLGASSLEIGILAALPALSHVAQIGGSFLLERGAPRKRLCVGSLAVSRVLWLPLLLFAALGTTMQGHGLVWALIALSATASAASALGGVAWLSWIRDLIPGNQRIGFLALRNQFDTVLAVSLSIVAAAFVDWSAISGLGSFAGYAVVFGAAIVCGLMGILLLGAIPDEDRLPESRARFGELLLAPLREANFRRLLGFYSGWYLSVNLAAPFFAVFMLVDLRIPLWQVTVLQTMSSIVGLMATRFWSRLSQQFGAKPVIFVASLGEAFFPFWWLFVTPHSTWALPLIFLSGIFSSPLATGPNNLLLSIAPAKNASPYMALFSAIVGPITALAAIAGGYCAEALGEGVSSGMFSLSALKLVFLLSFLGRLASLICLRRVHEPGASSIWCVARVFDARRFRLPNRNRQRAPISAEVADPSPQQAA